MSETVETVVEFLKDAGLTVTRFYGDEIVAYCPWHEDTNASLAINVSNGWHCFNGCGKGRSLQSLLDKLAPNKGLYQRLLDLSPQMYFRKNPFGTEKEDTSPLFDVEKLPLATDNEYLHERGIKNETIKDFNLKYHQGYNSIVVPIYQNDKLMGSVQRKIVGNPKYLNSKGMDKDRILFPFDKVQSKDDKIILVEGLFDAIKAHQEGVVNAVSSFGGNLSEIQARMLGSLARTVIICPDKDTSGIKMAHRTTDILLKLGLKVEYTFAPGKAKDFGDVEDFSKLQFHSYWKLKALKRNLNNIMELANA